MDEPAESAAGDLAADWGQSVRAYAPAASCQLPTLRFSYSNCQLAEESKVVAARQGSKCLAGVHQTV